MPMGVKLGRGQYRNAVASGPSSTCDSLGLLESRTRRYRVTVLTSSNTDV